MRNWLLPEFIEDILPAEAARIEFLREKLLGVFRSYGYELVIPPMLEYLESLLTGTGHDLDLRTFKLVDQLYHRGNLPIRAQRFNFRGNPRYWPGAKIGCNPFKIMRLAEQVSGLVGV